MAKAGRPQGSKNQPRDAVVTTATRCMRCGSTERAPYTRTMVQHFNGIAPDGKPFSAIRRRWTTCLTCGQVRVDRVYEYAPDAGHEEKTEKN